MTQAKLFHCNEKIFSDLFKKCNKYLGFKASLDEWTLVLYCFFTGKNAESIFLARFLHTLEKILKGYMFVGTDIYVTLLYVIVIWFWLFPKLSFDYIEGSTIMSSTQRPYFEIRIHITFKLFSFHKLLSRILFYICS